MKKSFFTHYKWLLGMLCLTITLMSSASDYPLVTITNTHSIAIESSINQQKYNLHIALPNHYGESDKTYPTLYLLDANNDFPLLVSMARRLYNENNLEPMIIVGLSYPEKPWYYRIADYTPSVMKRNAHSGKADAFIAAIEKEIIPLIDKNYQTNVASRTIAGHSLGGLLSSYLLINNSSLFHQYIISSPSMWWDNFKVFSFAQQNYIKETKVFISVGALEGEHMKTSADKLATFITKKQLNTKLKRRIIDNQDHGNVKFRAYAEALQWLFVAKK
ncbi:alpha/beta hydrolase [Aliikangiella sp. IMCC44359]|uniref:alpha/beta hydrolase n=1 Tax=Aliikangiella sp. IMCC44359 TaxID=3459125 RepID=UPI00403A8149